MSRSLKKGPYINLKLIEKIKNLKAGEKKVINTWDRGAVISPEMVGHRFGIHNGRKHIEVLIIEDMVGHKLGEFSPTRKFIRHGGRIAKEEEAAAVAGNTKTSVASDSEEKSKANTGSVKSGGK